MPMKFSGWYNWIIMALIMTKSPTVWVPLRMPEMHISMVAVRPAVKITACPVLSSASEV